MSKIALVGASNALSAFAAEVASKATGGKVTIEAGAAAAQSLSCDCCVGNDVHTSVVQASADVTPNLYRGTNVTFVRAHLPKNPELLDVRDAIDVNATSGISNEKEVATAKASFAKTADIAVNLAKQQGGKLTVLTKATAKHEVINAVFAEVISEKADAAGVAVESLPSAQVANGLVMFPETLGVVASADTPTADNAEAMVSGILGGVSRTCYTDKGSFSNGGSTTSVANAVASSLRASGLAKEASAIEKAAAAANGDQKAILGKL